MMVIVEVPRIPIWEVISLFIPWVRDIKPVTAAMPIMIPRRLSANLNFLSLRLSMDMPMTSNRFNHSHLMT